MTLQYPWVLLLLLLVPAMLYLRGRMHRKRSVFFSDGAILTRLPKSPAVVMQPVLAVVYALGLSLLIVAAARPLKGLDDSVVRTDAVDIVLAVDVSTSMFAEDIAEQGVNRLDAAKQVIEKFIASRTADRIAVVAFAGMPYSVAPLTLDHNWLIERIKLKEFRPGMLPEDGTAIGSALASAINRLRDSEAKSKVIVLLTDGVNNAGSLSPENAAQAAKAVGIRVYTVGAGTGGIVRVPIDDPLFGRRYTQENLPIDEATLKRIAEITDAEYFRATNMRELQKVYQQIDELEKTAIEVEQFTRFEEAFSPFLAAAMILLALERLLSLTRFGRLP
jgi:Ca-activated chloride channel family protein